MALLAFLGFIAVVLTGVMFATKQSMLGFACAMFWAMTGAQAYTLSTIPWGDIYFYVAFASMLGMTTFTALGAFGLREKRDTIADEEMEKGEGELIGSDEKKDDIDYWSGRESPTGERPQPARRRTVARGRSRTTRKKKGEFGF